MWISGIHPAEEMLRRRPRDVERVVFCRHEGVLRSILDEAAHYGVPAERVSREELSRLLGYRQHQGVAVRVRAFPYQTWEELMTASERVPSPLVLLDSLEDPQNVGAIFRSAAFFGMKAVVLPVHRSVSVTDAVCRVSAGALSMIPLVRVNNLAGAIDDLRSQGFAVVGLDAHADLVLYDLPLSLHPLAVVLGNEHRGMRRLVRERCHHVVTIPRVGEMESLNVAAAAAVTFAELSRQMRSWERLPTPC